VFPKLLRVSAIPDSAYPILIVYDDGRPTAIPFYGPY